MTIYTNYEVISGLFVDLENDYIRELKTSANVEILHHIYGCSNAVKEMLLDMIDSGKGNYEYKGGYND